MLQNLKVVELASVLAGPSVGMFFAELGAKVVKVENKTTNGDITRQWKLPNEPKEQPISAYYCSVNWGKEVVLLDLTQANDLTQVYELVKTADIVISNFKTGGAKKLKLDYATLKELNPTLIYGELTAFGPTNKRTAYDVVLQAESGFMYMNGTQEGEIVKMPIALIDVLAAHQLKEGILVALIERLKTGKGAYVSASLIDSAIASLVNQATNWLMGKHIPKPMGTLHPNIAPYGEMFTTADDKLLVLAIGSDKQFCNFCRVIQQIHLATDERFITNRQRLAHRQSLFVLLTPIIKQYNRADLIALLTEQQVPVGAVRNMKEVFELEAAKQLVLTENIAGVATERVKTAVFTIISNE